MHSARDRQGGVHDDSAGVVAMPKKVTVLLVEDSPVDVRLIREIINETRLGPFAVLEPVARLSAALQRLDAGGIDVVLLDLGLPDSQGLDTLLSLRAQAPRVPVVVLTVVDESLGKITLGTPEPGTCETTWGPAPITLEGEAGPDGALVGFTCAGGAGSGNASLSITARFISIASDTVRVDLAQSGNAMKLVLTEHNASRDIVGVGTLTEDSVGVPDCGPHPMRTTWTGVIAFENVQQSF